MKTEVYSWRVSAEVKAELEREARLRGMPVSAVLEAAVRDWLSKDDGSGDDEATQRKLQASAARSIGVLASGEPGRSEHARELVRQRLRRRHAH